MRASGTAAVQSSLLVTCGGCPNFLGIPGGGLDDDHGWVIYMMIPWFWGQRREFSVDGPVPKAPEKAGSKTLIMAFYGFQSTKHLEIGTDSCCEFEAC